MDQPTTAAETPETAIEDTPEFKAKLAEMRSQVVAELRAEIANLVQNGSASAGSQDMLEMSRMIAMSMAEVADQGTNRKRVAPEILASRAAARERMLTALAEVRKQPRAHWPRYRLIAKCYFGDKLIDPYTRLSKERVEPTQIIWGGIPNLAMRPLNEAARRVYAEYDASVGTDARVKMEAPPVYVTDHGLVVVGSGTASMRAHDRVLNPGDEAPYLRDPEAELPNGDGSNGEYADLPVVTQDDPRNRQVHVLGTIAPAAQQSTIKENLV